MSFIQYLYHVVMLFTEKRKSIFVSPITKLVPMLPKTQQLVHNNIENMKHGSFETDIYRLKMPKMIF